MTEDHGPAKIKYPTIGLLALKNKLITKEELEAGMASCAGSENPDLALKEYFIARELISAKNLQRLSQAVKALTIRQKEYRFGVIAIKKGYANKTVLDLALEEQEADIRQGRKPRLIGDMMVEAGFISEEHRNQILKMQNREPKPYQPSDAVETQAQGTRDAGGTPPGENGAQEKENSKDGGEVKEDPAKIMLEPETICGGIQLQVAGDFMAAFFSKTPAFNPDVLVSDIKDDLFDRGIVAGLVVDEMIEGFINSSGFKTKKFRVAQGIRPVAGQDAKLEFFFNTDYLKAGGLDEKGNIDFKDRGEIPLVEKGTVLAEKTPRVGGRNGQNIYGDEVITEPGQDKALQFGKGAVLSEDGLKILSGVRGYPKYSLSGVVFVHEEYTTGGDVDYETGHIDYNGNVNVKGCIKSGFRVRGNDIKAVELDGGIIEAEGDLVVAGGINEGKIYARGNVYAKFVLKSEIVCMGSVQVGKEIVDSTVECGGFCAVENGKLISSRVTAKMGLSARDIGTEMTSPNVIRVGHDAFTEKEIQKNRAQTNEVREEIFALQEKKEGFNSKVAELQQQITKLAHIQDRSQLEQRELKEKLSENPRQEIRDDLEKQMGQLENNALNAEKNLDVCFEKSEAAERAVDKIDRDIEKLSSRRDALVGEKKNILNWSRENPGKAVVMVQGAIQAETHIRGKHSEITMDQMARHSRVMEMLISNEEDETRNFYQMQLGNL